MNKQERAAKIQEYGGGYDILEAELAKLPREAWKFKPAAGEWSVQEILEHMADSECMGIIRLHKVIAEPGSLLMTYEEAKWADALHYQDGNAEVALQLFGLLRQRTHGLLSNLPDQTFDHSVRHPEYAEPYNIDRWLDIYVGHVIEHVAQMRRVREAWQDQGRPAS